MFRSDDNKEGTFEVSLFAELFNEMLMRDHAFNIYKVILTSFFISKGAGKNVVTFNRTYQQFFWGDTSLVLEIIG